MLTRNRNRHGSLTVSDGTAESLPPETETCRVCLKEGDIPLFGDNNIAKDVMEFGCIEIGYNDNLPQHICDACHSLLQAAVLFRNTAQKSDEVLKTAEYLDEEKISIFTEEPDEKYSMLYDTDNESSIKREYLEYKETSESESEMNFKYEAESEYDSTANLSQDPDNVETKYNNTNIQMQLLKVKEEVDNSNDADNELVMIIVSDKNKTNTPIYNCTKCNLPFQDKTELEKHDQENHLNTIHTLDHKKCDICNKSVVKSSYQVHIKEHRNQYKKKFDRMYAKVECVVCSKKIAKSYYKFHMKMHGSKEEQAERVILCTICNKSFSSNYFTDHMKRMHERKQSNIRKSQKFNEKNKKKQKLSKCPVCDKMVEEDIYKDHLAKHGGPNKLYICDQCGKEFKYPSAFKTHTLTHGSELKYQCQFCPYRGLHLGLLKIHVRTHTGDYNYKCKNCPARFITKSNLTRHIERRHEGIGKYKCDLCNRAFYAKRDVDRHIKTVHLCLKNNICDFCGKGFGHRDNLLNHQLKVHKREKIVDTKGRIPSYLKEEMLKSINVRE